MLTAKQYELLNFIHHKLEDSGISPSFEEMKEALDLRSKSGVHRLISALEERGFLRRLPNRARALEVLKIPEHGRSKPVAVNSFGPVQRSGAQAVGAGSAKSGSAHAGWGSSPGARNSGPIPVAANDVLEIPLHGRIAAGMPIEALEGQNSLSVPMALLGAGEHYALEVAGDSMIDAGILDGDLALIRKTETARDGEIVVALVRGEEATLKYLRHEGGQVRLDPANAAYEPQYYDPREVVIQGRLAGLLRRYH